MKEQIIEELKKEGLILGEESAEQAIESAFKIIGKIVELSENKYDDMVWAAVSGKAKQFLLDKAEEISKDV